MLNPSLEPISVFLAFDPAYIPVTNVFIPALKYFIYFRFNIKCFYTLYHVATLIGQVFMTSFSLIYFFDSDVSLTSISTYENVYKPIK